MNHEVSLLIKFSRNGGVDFYPILRNDGDAYELATRLHRLIRVLIENPTAVKCASGYHEHSAGCHRR